MKVIDARYTPPAKPDWVTVQSIPIGTVFYGSLASGLVSSRGGLINPRQLLFKVDSCSTVIALDDSRSTWSNANGHHIFDYQPVDITITVNKNL
jgi:hypothetical protein